MLSEQHSSLRAEVWVEGGSGVGQAMGGASAGMGEALRWAGPPARPPCLYNALCRQDPVLGVASHAARPWVSYRGSHACGQRLSRQGRAAFETQNCVCLSPELAFSSLPCSPRLEKSRMR